jgi:hypothetical protein
LFAYDAHPAVLQIVQFYAPQLRILVGHHIRKPLPEGPHRRSSGYRPGVFAGAQMLQQYYFFAAKQVAFFN